MFERDMMDNLAVINSDNLQAINNNDAKWNNPWRELVTPQFKAFLDNLSTSSKEDIETTENEEE